jgi:hypothetical protein
VTAADTILRAVVASYCKAAGPPWAIDLPEELDAAAVAAAVALLAGT